MKFRRREVRRCVMCGEEDSTIRPHPSNGLSEYCTRCLVHVITLDLNWEKPQ